VFNYTWPSKWLVSPCVGLRARVAAHYKWIIYARALTTADGWGIRMWMKPLAGDPVGWLGEGDTTARRLSHGGLRQRPILVNAKWVVAASRWCHKRELEPGDRAWDADGDEVGKLLLGINWNLLPKNFAPEGQITWLWCENYLPGKRRQRRRKKAQTQKLLEQIFAFCLSNGQVHISQHILSYDLIG